MIKTTRALLIMLVLSLTTGVIGYTLGDIHGVISAMEYYKTNPPKPKIECYKETEYMVTIRMKCPIKKTVKF